MSDEFKEWFIASARAPIDPWHKEFARAVWKAATAAERKRTEKLVEALEESLRFVKDTFEYCGKPSKPALGRVLMLKLIEQALREYGEADNEKA